MCHRAGVPSQFIRTPRISSQPFQRIRFFARSSCRNIFLDRNTSIPAFCYPAIPERNCSRHPFRTRDIVSVSFARQVHREPGPRQRIMIFLFFSPRARSEHEYNTAKEHDRHEDGSAGLSSVAFRDCCCFIAKFMTRPPDVPLQINNVSIQMLPARERL